jgi:large subunit ribosomal protein L44e
MKVPKNMNRHCPFCNKHTEHVVTLAKRRGKNFTHPMGRGSMARMKLRSSGKAGLGNHGRYSRPNKPKMSGKKLNKNTDFRYSCKVCKKTHVQKSGQRLKKVELI